VLPSQAARVLVFKVKLTKAYNTGPDLRAGYEHKRDANCHRPLPGSTEKIEFCLSAFHRMSSMNE
jgi:hypothetical protein